MTGPKAFCPQCSLPRREALRGLGGSALGLLLWPAGGPVAAARAPGSGAERRADAFEPGAVRLLAGPFKTAQDLDARYLLQLEPDRLLHNFRVNAGVPPRAPVYGGWESQEPWVDIRCHGHTLGHYLSACALMYASTGDAAFQQRVGYIVAELKACQSAAGTGLVCAFPDGATPLLNSLQGKPFSGVPWYTTHKIMAGLRDAKLYAQCAPALEVLEGVAGWISAQAADISDTAFQAMLDREHGGMNEVLADLGAMTGNPAHLQLAERFCHQALLEPLARGRDALDGLHANSQIPKVIGFARLHELTGAGRYLDAAGFFWRTVVTQRSFATGGHGDAEHFFPPARVAEHLHSAKTMETCCTYNMLRLTRALFQRAPDVAYADYYERALFNGILASQDPDSGMLTYFQSTRPGYVRLYCTPTESFWCCTGSGMESHAKYGDSIYFHDADTLYVNLFIASQLAWRARQLQITQITKFPDESTTQLRISATQPTRMRLKIRQPAWSARTTIAVNGRQHSIGTPGLYFEIERTWHDGDVVDVALQMDLRLERLPGAPGLAAIMCGPIVLAARCGSEGLQADAQQIVNERTYGQTLTMPMEIPRLAVSAENLRRAVRQRGLKALNFQVAARSPDRDFELAPYFRLVHERYNLYWQIDG